MKKKAVAEKKHKKDMSINDLAGMMQKGFSASDKKFETMDKKFENLVMMTQRGFTDLEDRLDKRFGNVDHELKSINHKADVLRAEMLSFHFDFKKLITRVEELEMKTFGSVQD